jgi:hypothetical protein
VTGVVAGGRTAGLVVAGRRALDAVVGEGVAGRCTTGGGTGATVVDR